jgi:hypothetical protein
MQFLRSLLPLRPPVQISLSCTDHKLAHQTLAEPGGKKSSPYFKKSFPTPPGKSLFSRRETFTRRIGADRASASQSVGLSMSRRAGPKLLAQRDKWPTVVRKGPDLNGTNGRRNSFDNNHLRRVPLPDAPILSSPLLTFSRVSGLLQARFRCAIGVPAGLSACKTVTYTFR